MFKTKVERIKSPYIFYSKGREIIGYVYKISFTKHINRKNKQIESFTLTENEFINLYTQMSRCKLKGLIKKIGDDKKKCGLQ